MEEEEFFDFFLKILGNKTRRSMLELLSDGPRFLSDISRELDIGQQAILRHIQEFIKAGILEIVEEDLEDERKIGRKPKYYRIAENRRIIVDITPDRFNIDTIPAFLVDEEGLKEEMKEKFCTDLSTIESEIESLEKIIHPNERYNKILQIEDQIQNEINCLIDAKHYAEFLLEKLRPKKKICKDYLGI